MRVNRAAARANTRSSREARYIARSKKVAGGAVLNQLGIALRQVPTSTIVAKPGDDCRLVCPERREQKLPLPATCRTSEQTSHVSRMALDNLEGNGPQLFLPTPPRIHALPRTLSRRIPADTYC